MKKSSIINWFRYHHYNTNPALESHSKYIGCLNEVECCEAERTGKYKEFASGANLNEDWKEILTAINNMSDEKLEHLGLMIKTRYK